MAQPLYPMMLDVSQRVCVIIGGGEVATRKARGLVQAGAKHVRMIAPIISTDVPDGVVQLSEIYRAEHLSDAGLVFAATDSAEVNDAIVHDAQSRGILVTRADVDDDSPGDFAVPARLDNGPVIVTISAGSAALSVMIRDQIADAWNPRWTKLAEAMRILRPEIKQQRDEQTRRKIFRDLATDPAMEALETGGIDGLRHFIAHRHGASHE